MKRGGGYVQADEKVLCAANLLSFLQLVFVVRAPSPPAGCLLVFGDVSRHMLHPRPGERRGTVHEHATSERGQPPPLSVHRGVRLGPTTRHTSWGRRPPSGMAE